MYQRRSDAVLKALRALSEVEAGLVFSLHRRGGGVVLLDALRKAPRALGLDFLSLLAVCPFFRLGGKKGQM